jgi:uncharacterized protein YigE (DUF2233 family)
MKSIAVLLAAICGCGFNVLVSAEDTPTTELQSVSFRGQEFLVRFIDTKKEDLRLFWSDENNNPLRDFSGLEKYVAANGEQLLFAANAGMYETDFRPVGLLVQNGKETSPLNLKDAIGNFYMKPNGIFLIDQRHEARIIESSEYPAILTPALWATQSGPLLVRGGTIHPKFNAESKNVTLRSGVGVRKDGLVIFAISQGQVSFYNFADFFLDRLDCPNALYLDGTISAFHGPGMKDPMPHAFGPMIGVVEKAKTP